MSMSDTLNIKLSTSAVGGSASVQTNDPLIRAIDSLSSRMSTFETAIRDFTTKTKVQNETMTRVKENLSQAKVNQTTDPTLIKIAQAKSDVSKIRAEFATSAEGKNLAEGRTAASLIRNRVGELQQQNLASVVGFAQTARASGDIKRAKEIEDQVTPAITKSVDKGIQNSKLKNVMNAIGAIGGIGLATSTIKGVISTDKQMALSMMQNPILNGYDYGSMVGGVMTANAQQKTGLLTAGGAGLAGLAAALIPGVGLAGIGLAAAGGGAIGSIMGASGESKTALQARSLGNYINNYMNLEAMQGTNASAAKLAMGSLGGGKHALTDIEAPLIMTMSKGVAVYNNNFKAMDELTKYAKSAQLNLGQAANYSGMVGLFSKDKNFNLSRMNDLFNTYGITPEHYGEITTRKTLFQQAGMSPDRALELATKAAGANPIAQGAMNSYYSQDLIERGDRVFLAQRLLGENLETMAESGNYSPQALAAKRRAEATIKSGGLNSNVRDRLRNILYPGGLFSVAESPIESRDIQSARQNPSMVQESFTNTINQMSSQAMMGADVNPSMVIGKWVEGITGSTINLDAFKTMLEQTTDTLSNFAKSATNDVKKWNPFGISRTESGSVGARY